MPGSPQYVKWHIGDDVSPAAAEAVVEGTRLMHELASSLGLTDIDEEIRFYLYPGVEGLAPVFDAVTGMQSKQVRPWWWQGNGKGQAAEAFRGNIFLTTSAFTSSSLMKIAAHELSHAQASAIAGFNNSGATSEVQTHGPVWLREGIAERHAYLAMDRGGAQSYSDYRSNAVSYVRSRAFPQLMHLETHEQVWAVGHHTYGYFVLAAELLASYAGESALIEYFALLQPGTTWQEAFEAAFGVTVEEFYELFEEHRAAGFPKVEVSESTEKPTQGTQTLGLINVSSSCAVLAGKTYDCRLFWVAGSGAPDVGDGGPAIEANLKRPSSVAVGPSGILIADNGNHRIRLVSPTGVIETVAGTGASEYRRVVDGDKATQATVRMPSALAAADDGTVYIGDFNYVVRKVSPEGVISTVLGRPFTYDVFPETQGTRATEAITGPVSAVESDGSGGIYVANQISNQVVRVDADGIIHVVAGTGSPGTAGEGRSAHMAELHSPRSLALDRTRGILYVCDAGNSRVAAISLDTGVLRTIPGIQCTSSIALDDQGNLYFSSRSQVWRWDSKSKSKTLIAGTDQSGRAGEGGPAAAATIGVAEDIAVDPEGNIYVADSFNDLVWRVSPDGVINVFAGGNELDLGDQTATDAYIWDGQGLGVDSQGNVVFTDYRNAALRQIGSDGIVRLIAGGPTGTGITGDGGHPKDASLSSAPTAPFFDGSGNLYFLDRPNVHYVRRIEPGADGIVNGSPDERISTVVGSRGDWRKTDRGTADGGPATNAVIQGLYGLVVDSTGTMYIANVLDNRIRKISPGDNGVVDGSQDEIIATIAGDGVAGSGGDGGPAKMARVERPTALAIDENDNIYMLESWRRVRRIEQGAHTISTVVILQDARSIDVGPRGEIYYGGPDHVGLFDPSSGEKFTLLRSGEGGTNSPQYVSVAPDGSIYIRDLGAFRILRVELVRQPQN